mmetsp:Transcript_51303/g.91691  ORF Transcript_51303/g.91691 Transcript_51303/m.91691 type:complete len:135 (-) Transcript_51303:410-814(-)
MSYADRAARDRDDRYGGREWGGRDRYDDRGSRGSRMMTSTVQAAGKYDLPQIDNKRKRREEKQQAKKQKVQEEIPLPEDEESRAMMAVMGMAGFTTTKGKTVEGNDKSWGVKTKSRTKFQYLSQRQRGPREEKE